MATFNKFNVFVEHLAEGVHNLQTGAITVALTSVSPSNGTATSIGDITQISYTNLTSTPSANRIVSPVSSAQTGGTYRLTATNDLTLTSTGAVSPFRYVVLYNSGSTGVSNALIGFYDYGSELTLANGETLTIDFDQGNGILTLA